MERERERERAEQCTDKLRILLVKPAEAFKTLLQLKKFRLCSQKFSESEQLAFSPMTILYLKEVCSISQIIIIVLLYSTIKLYLRYHKSYISYDLLKQM